MAIKNAPAQIWVPDLTIVTNLDTLVLLDAFFAINGSLVQCYLAVTVDPTAGTVFDFRCSLPTGQPLGAVSDLIGTCGVDGAGAGGTVQGVAATNDALITSLQGLAAVDLFAHFAYRIP